MFVDDVERERYDVLITRKISEPKYLDVELLQALGLWDNINAFLGRLGWSDYVQLRFPVYEKLVLCLWMMCNVKDMIFGY